MTLVEIWCLWMCDLHSFPATVIVYNAHDESFSTEARYTN